MVRGMGVNGGRYLGRARSSGLVRDVDGQSTVRLDHRPDVDRLGAGGLPGHETPMAEAAPAHLVEVDPVPDAEIAEAITAWQTWEDAINRTGQGRTPAWMRANGRRWADPGE